MLAELQALQLMPSAAQPQPRSMTYDDTAKLTYTCNAIKVNHCPSRRSCLSAVDQCDVAGTAESHHILPSWRKARSTMRPELLCMVLAQEESSLNVAQEAMRMLPVLADGTNRTTTSDVKLGPHLIPKGTMVWVPLKGLFNSPHNWANPEQYTPVCSHPLLMPRPLTRTP